MGSPNPELPDTTLFVTVFGTTLPSRYFGLTSIRQRRASRFSSLTGCERVNDFIAVADPELANGGGQGRAPQARVSRRRL